MNKAELKAAGARLEKLKQERDYLLGLSHETIERLRAVNSKILHELTEIETGPEQSREEVTGLGGAGGKNRNAGNSGFSGGTTVRVAPAMVA